MSSDGDLLGFAAPTREWFAASFAVPTPAQLGAWQAVGKGEHTLVVAPTGSGKTLAAFLWSLDRLATQSAPADPMRRCRVLYVSPLKALAVDIERNLRAPLAGMRHAASRLGLPVPDITVAVRSGDTPADQRRRLGTRPPDILITTPESLFLLLTSSAREALRGVRTVIVDEIHAVVATKRGAHLALSLERLDALLDQPAQRIGLSATVRPLEEVATFLVGRPGGATIVAPPADKQVEVEIVVPVRDMTSPSATLAVATDPPQPDVEPQSDPESHEAFSDQQPDALMAPADFAVERDGDRGTDIEPERPSIWPAVEERVVDLIGRHRSTIVFANSRRLTERLTARVNELAAEREITPPRPEQGPPAEVTAQAGQSYGAPAVLARAHHGSVSKEQRADIEEALKTGRLRAVVATSSLELGIDMGSVDLVVQVEPPPSVTSGLQRIGRAGHQVGAPSRGVVFPKHRGDLVPTAVVSERMRVGAIEQLHFLRNPLDVLAQQLVAMAALDSWELDELATLIRKAAPFAELPDSALVATLDMLAGRYPSDEFAELRPRLVWDRVNDVISGRPGAQRLAVTSGGTIPDRGLYGVFLVGEKASRVGELDEEMVYESRVGDVFTLGSTSWRIEDITHDRVLVSPAPGIPGKLPFWKGDAPGRPAELGRAIGGFVRELSRLDESAARARLAEAGLDEWATDNLLAYLREQREATGTLPDDRTIVIERFRDELGDWRLVVHSALGAPIHAPWALAIGARLREMYGVDVQAIHSDDGIVLRLLDVAEPPPGDVVIFDPDELSAVVEAELGGSALFAARFRECAARALLLPRRDPRRRSPLWQQRQRSAQLLAVAARYPSFPIILETMRECLQDVFDLPGLTTLMRHIDGRRIRVAEAETQTPSPFARTLLFGYVAAFMYEGDAPLAERRAQALTLDTALLSELLGRAELRELLDESALAELEEQAQWLSVRRRAHDLESTADLLRVVGDLTTEEAGHRGARPEWLAELAAARRALPLRIAGESRWAAVEDAARFRDALGVPLPPGVPAAFLEPVADPVGDLVGRYARTHGPFTAGDVANRLAVGVAVVDAALRRLAGVGRVVLGEFRPGGAGPEWCDTEVLRTLRRRSLAKLRQEAEPVPPGALAKFLTGWQGVQPTRPNAEPIPSRGGTRPAADSLLRVIDQLAGALLPVSALETLVLPSRVEQFTPALLDGLTAAGDVVWAGAGSLPGGDGWVVVCPAGLAELLLPPPAELDLGPLHRGILSALEGGVALFFRGLSDRVGSLDDSALADALWELVWAGYVTNDTLGPLRALHSARGSPAGSVQRRAMARPYRQARPRLPSRTGPPTVAGRWSLLPLRETDPTRRTHALVETLLDRHGVLTKGAVVAERVSGGFAGIYPVLSALEEAGRCRRGYFVEGLGGAQFAMPGAVDRLRASTSEPASAAPGWRAATPSGFAALPTAREPAAVVMAAADPAQPYGAALPWPTRADTRDHPDAPAPSPARKAGSTVVLVDGELLLYLERGGRSLRSYDSDPARLALAVDALVGAVRRGVLGRLLVERADGEPVIAAGDTPLAATLQAAGFIATPRGLRMRA